MKNKTIMYGAIAVIALMIIMNQGGNLSLKGASAGLGASRVFSGGSGPNHVLAGQVITATYTPETFNYFAIIEDVPAGWTPDRSLSPDGKIRTTADGSNIVIQWTAPTTLGVYNFGGEYFVYPDETYTGFAADAVEVCANQNYFQCYTGDVYYYTSCNDRQTVKETCTADACESWQADYCSGAVVTHDRTCYTVSCPVDACTQNPYTDTQTVTTAPNSNSGTCAWTCTGGACDQNTAADTNYDGCVHDAEFPVAVSNWKQQTGGITDIVFPTVVANWKSMANCI